jgi:hypothetical protein
MRWPRGEPVRASQCPTLDIHDEDGVRILFPMCVIAVPLTAQTNVTLPHGIQTYQVDGSYKDMAMAPWRAELEIRDTTLNDARRIVVQHRYVHDVPRSTFDYSAFLTADAATMVSASWINGGREPNRCDLAISSDSIRGAVRVGDFVAREVKVKPLPLRGRVVPDFALGAVVAMRPLSDGDALRLTVVRCLPQWNEAAITLTLFVGVVASGEAPRAAGAPAEAVWRVTGGADYPASITIAKSDRQLLTVTIPEGSVGSQTESFRGTRKSSP